MLAVRVLVASLLLLLPVGSARAACVDPEDPPVSIDVPTLSVSVAAARPTYTRGQVAPVRVEVHLVTGQKAEKAVVEVTVSARGKKLTTLHGRTDATGVSTTRLRLPRGLEPGALTAIATARIEQVPSYDCRGALVYHFGQDAADPLLTVT